MSLRRGLQIQLSKSTKRDQKPCARETFRSGQKPALSRSSAQTPAPRLEGAMSTVYARTGVYDERRRSSKQHSCALRTLRGQLRTGAASRYFNKPARLAVARQIIKNNMLTLAVICCVCARANELVEKKGGKAKSSPVSQRSG